MGNIFSNSLLNRANLFNNSNKDFVAVEVEEDCQKCFLDLQRKSSLKYFGKVVCATRTDFVSLAKLHQAATEAGLPPNKLKNLLRYDKNICYTRQCLKSAHEIFSGLNLTADPCTDWLEFACSKRDRKDLLLNDFKFASLAVSFHTLELLEQSMFHYVIPQNFLLREAQVYFYQCNNKELNDEKDVKEVLHFLEGRYGGWPMVTDKKPGLKFNWLGMLADLNQIESSAFSDSTLPFLQVKVLEPSGLSSTFGTFEITAGLKWEWSDDEFTDYIHKILMLSGYHWNPDDVNTAYKKMAEFIEAINIAANKYLFSDQEILSLAALQWKTDSYLQSHPSFNSMDVNWAQFFAIIFKDCEIDVGAPGILVQMNFHRVMAVLETIEKYLAIGEVKTLSNILNFQLANLLLQETTVLFDNSAKQKNASQQKYDCFQKTVDIFGYSLSKSYMNLRRLNDDNGIIPTVKEMSQNVVNNYIGAIRKTYWISQPTQNHLIEKLEQLQFTIAEPDWTKDAVQLKDFYRNLNASSDWYSSHPLNYWNVGRWAMNKRRRFLFHRHGHFSDDSKYWSQSNGCGDSWSNDLMEVNACNKLNKNHIVLPGGNLLPPFFGMDRPGFMNYGALGVTISHEVGHIFGPWARRFNGNGVQGADDFWDSEAINRYHFWIESLWQDYKHSKPNVAGPFYATVADDIADNLGLSFAFLTYKQYLDKLDSEGKAEMKLPGLSRRFTPEQLFFLKYSSKFCERKENYGGLRFKAEKDGEHSEGDHRATIPVKRSKFFAQAFGCPFPKTWISRFLNI